MASFADYCRAQRPGLRRLLGPGSEAELYHFIGKDIVYFHSLFWPAVLKGSGIPAAGRRVRARLPDVNGQKMSKSRGTFITARPTWHGCRRVPALLLRAKLSAGVEDIDLNLEEFVARVNADLVGKLVNIASRCAGFITRGHAGRLATALPDPGLYESFVAAGETIARLYEDREYAAAIREIMALADRANVYIDQHKPWLAAKDPARAAEVQAVCTQGLNLFRALMVYLKPVLPAMAEGPGRALERRFQAAARQQHPALRAAGHAA
jgi:methionyl-tRNA synthetase